MKKLSLKSKILLAALILGGSAAGATEVVNKITQANQETYNWTHYNQSGNPIGELNDATVQEARDQLGCPGETSTLCADAPNAPVDLFYN
uniref:Uncharacterized protein n=1 Tax=Sphingobacterium sp. (strain 21) TaxID=743722 RepID=F4C138_SPHS2